MSVAADADEPLIDVLNELIALALEGAETHAAAAERVHDGDLKQVLTRAAQSHRETEALLAEEVRAHGGQSADESAVRRFSTAAKAALAGAASNHLGDASVAEMAKVFEEEMAQTCRRVSRHPDLGDELRRAVQWAADKAELRCRELERRTLSLGG